MYTALLGHLSSALLFAGAFVVVLVLVTELARAVRVVGLRLRGRAAPSLEPRTLWVSSDNGPTVQAEALDACVSATPSPAPQAAQLAMALQLRSDAMTQ